MCVFNAFLGNAWLKIFLRPRPQCCVFCCSFHHFSLCVCVCQGLPVEFLCCAPSVSAHLDVCGAGHDGQALHFIPDPLRSLRLSARLCHSHGPLYPQKRGRTGTIQIPIYSSAFQQTILIISTKVQLFLLLAQFSLKE